MIKKINLQSQTEHKSFNSDDIVLPDHFIEDINTFVDVLAFSRIGKLVDKEIAKGTQVAAQSTSTDSFNDSISSRVNALSF